MRLYETYDQYNPVTEDEVVRAWVLKGNMYWWNKEMKEECEEFEDLDAEIEQILADNE